MKYNIYVLIHCANTCKAAFSLTCGNKSHDNSNMKGRAAAYHQNNRMETVKNECLRGGISVGSFNTKNVTEHLQNDQTKECEKYVQALGAKDKWQGLKQTWLEEIKV